MGISFSLGPLSLCFVNCHLAARASEARKLRFVFGTYVEYYVPIEGLNSSAEAAATKNNCHDCLLDT